MEDIIAAVSTGSSPGGIGMIRISGSGADVLCDRIFTAYSNTLLSSSEGYRAHYGKIHDGDRVIDNVIVLIFRAPHSFTGEDTAEITCHGGLTVEKEILSAALKAGARSALPGEFTKRAFLNGKMDLTEAESVMTLISARSAQAADAAFSVLSGTLSKKIDACASVFISACASMSAWVDYPDEDIEDLDPQRLLVSFKQARTELASLIDSFDAGQAVTSGVRTVIAGSPNVGKSTIMNLLLGHDRSIVTDIAGTTRDVIEETAVIGNVTLRLADTAGLRDSDDPVESAGVALAKKRLDSADLIIAVFDASRKLSDEDKKLLSACKNKKSIAVINKTDLNEMNIDTDLVSSFADETVFVSAVKDTGFDEFRLTLEKVLGTAQFDTSCAMLTTVRQKDGCIKALSCIDEAIAGLQSGITLDAVNVSCEAAVDALSEISGKKASDSVLDEIFSKFCVGK